MVELITGLQSAVDPFTFDFASDSRGRQMFNSSGALVGLTATNWFNWANTQLGQCMNIGYNVSISGKRTDEYLTDANMAPVLASNSGWLMFGPPAVNDLTQAMTGYTDADGNAVTLSNVAMLSVARIIKYALLAQKLKPGKKIIVTAEAGATGLSAAAVKELHRINLMLRAFAAATPGVFYWSPNKAIWNPTGSGTLVTFRTGMSTDGTHRSVLGGFTEGMSFYNFIKPLLPIKDVLPCLQSDVYGNFDRQFARNNLFTSQSGGTLGSNMTLDAGAIPANWTLSGSVAMGAHATLSYAANAEGIGSDLRLQLSATSAGTVYLALPSPSTSEWNINSLITGGISMDVAAASVNAFAFWDTNIAGNAGAIGLDHWAMYPVNLGPFPTVAYSMTVKSKPQAAVDFASGITSTSWIVGKVGVNFSGAGSIDLTIRRPNLEWLYTFANGVIS